MRYGISVLLGIGFVLIGDEAGCAVVDQFVEGLWFQVAARVMLRDEPFRCGAEVT